MLTRKFIKKEDIDLINKLSNMLDSEISKDVYDRCMNEDGVLNRIEDKIWKMIGNSALPYSRMEYFKNLGNDIEAEDEKEFWSGCFYNCDLLYMQAIAYVLGLEIPKSSCDTGVFGIGNLI